MCVCGEVCSWCNGFYHKKSSWCPEFKFWTWLLAKHQYLWERNESNNSPTSYGRLYGSLARVFNLCMTTALGEGKF